MATILILEDDFDLANQWSRAFEAANYRVFVASSSPIARSIIETEEVDLIISDMFIKEGNDYLGDGGLTLLGHTRIYPSKVTAKRIPLIAITGSSMRLGPGIQVLETAKDLGAVDTMQKPVEIDELLELVAKHLPEKRASDA